MATVRLEGLEQLKNPMTSNGNQNRDLPARSAVPQQTTLPRTPYLPQINNKKVI
jgi:hypothetical protein